MNEMNDTDELQAMLVGTLPDDVPLQEMVRLADAILASPVLTVIVDNKTENGEMLVQTLTERGENLLEVVPLNGRNPLSLFPGFAEDPETPEDAALFLEHGVPGILLSLWLHNEQTMAETIKRAREYRKAILEAVEEE